MGKLIKNAFRSDYSAHPSETCFNAVCIPGTKGMHILIDSEDYEEISKYWWNCHKFKNSFDAFSGWAKNIFRMHRMIMKSPDLLHVDHINGNGLDNRKSNLRICTRKQNSMNRRPNKIGASQYKGVYWKKENQKWAAQLGSNPRYYLGYFGTEKEAAEAYNKKALEIYGEFAQFNMIEVKND